MYELTELSEKLVFPPLEMATPEGIVAYGGDLSVDRLLLAYRNGIFPWYSDDTPILWWNPDPRFVLFPEQLKVSKSMRQLLRQKKFEIKYDLAFEQVLEACQKIPRKDQDGTWITDEMQGAYITLHKLGIAHSAEAYLDGVLVGGLYGVQLGKVFFGESMFTHQSNASKAAFIQTIEQFKTIGIELVDCQVHTDHLESLGAAHIKRDVFMDKLNFLVNQKVEVNWKNWNS